MIQKDSQLEKKKKLEGLLFKLLVAGPNGTGYVKKSGNRVRHLTRVIAESYKDNPDELRKFFEDKNQFVAGVATSAYHFLTGDIKPMQKTEYGGLGAIIVQSEQGLKFSKSQLNYAKLSGTALQHSKNKGYSLQYSENSEDALQNSRNRGGALIESINSGNALKNSRNRGYALQDSTNSGNALIVSKNTGYSLRFSKNSDNAKKFAINTDDLSLQRQYARVMQENIEYDLKQSRHGILTSLFYSFCQFLDDHSRPRYSGTSGIFIPRKR